MTTKEIPPPTKNSQHQQLLADTHNPSWRTTLKDERGAYVMKEVPLPPTCASHTATQPELDDEKNQREAEFDNHSQGDGDDREDRDRYENLDEIL